MSILWRKVLGDARRNGRQMALIFVVLALGAAGVVAALDAQSILKREIAASYAGAHAPDIALWFEKVDAQSAAEVAAHEQVAGVDARRVTFSRVEIQDGSWLPMRLVILESIDKQGVGRIHRHESAAGAAGIWIEQSGMPLIAAGKPVKVRTPTGATATVPLAGYVHDPAIAPSTQERLIYAFVTREGALALGQSPEPDQLQVRMKVRGDAANAALLAQELREGLATRGRAPLRYEVLPNAHPHVQLMNAMLRILGVICVLAFACSASLAGYLVAAWMRREVRLVGILKTLGARWHQVAWQYLLLVGPLAIAVVAVALPAGSAIGLALVRYYTELLNIDVASWNVHPVLRVQEVAFTLAIALGAMAWPIVRASRVSVREALHDAGIASPLTAGSRLATKVNVPAGMRWTFAVRNAVRRPFRLALILLALACGGALLVGTKSNYKSLMGVVDTNLATQGHDIEAVFPTLTTGAQLESVARAVPGVEIAEAWRRASVNVDGQGGDRAHRVPLLAFPPGSRLFKLPVLEGRMPSADATNEVLMTRSVGDLYPAIRVGSEIGLPFRDRTARVRVVGLVEEVASTTFYAMFPTFEAVTGLGDASNRLRAKASGGADVTNRLDQALLEARMPPAQVLTRDMFRDALEEHIRVVGEVMRMVALAVALVGAIVLCAGTGIDVLDRTRELGVLRALGATPRVVAGILLAEGAFIAALGTLLSLALSGVLIYALTSLAAKNLLRVAVPMQVSYEALGLLALGAALVVAAIGATLAVLLRRPVREALSYDG